MAEIDTKTSKPGQKSGSKTVHLDGYILSLLHDWCNANREPNKFRPPSATKWIESQILRGLAEQKRTGEFTFHVDERDLKIAMRKRS